MNMIEAANRIKGVEEYYFSKKLAEVRSLDSPELRVINLGIGSPDLAPSENAIDALIASAKNPANHGYQNYKGIPQLRQAIVDFYKKIYSVSLNAETEILPLMGSKEGIMHICMAFVNEGDEVLIPDPGYPTYASVAKLTGAKIVTYQMSEKLNWGIDVEALRKKDLSKVKIMWVNFPHMPTGRIASKEELKELVDLARENNFLIVNDNPYSLILNETPLSILSIEGAEDVALELNSLSKSHNMAGWRIGFMVGNRDLVHALARIKSYHDYGTFTPIQVASIAALEGPQDCIEEICAQYQRRRDVLAKGLHEAGWMVEIPKASMYIWAEIPDPYKKMGSLEFAKKVLNEAKVAVSPGIGFGDYGDTHVRFALIENEHRIRQAVRGIKEMFRKDGLLAPRAVERVIA